MIQRVYEQCLKAEKLTKVIIATDDARIADHARAFGAEVVMTSDQHETGTDRCAEAFSHLEDHNSYDYVVNIQGDEPFIAPALIDQVCEMLNYKTEIATAVRKIEDQKTLEDPNVVKVILTLRKQALYFSRQIIPYVRDVPPEQWLQSADFFKHIGIYGFRSDVLEQIVKLPPNVLEQTEKLEQLRWLGYGYKIYATETDHFSFGIDRPEDLESLGNKL